MTKRKKGCLGCGGAAVLAFIVLAIIGAIVGPPKKTAATSTAAASPSLSVASSSKQPPPPSVSRPAPTSAKATPKPQQTSGDFKQLDHGAQQGLGPCIIEYKDAQMGTGTSTFSALILDDSGQPYSPADSDPYSVMLQLSITGTDGSSYSISEALGGGSRTAADNGGSDWFTVNQDGAQVSADSTAGMVDTTVPISLSEVKSAQGYIMVTSETDANYLKQENCAVRPSL